MTSTTTGLPDRYRPLDQVGPDEPTATGVIRSWRAKDRVLNRDVAIRVHTPARAGRARLDHPRAHRRRPGHPRAGDGLRRLRGHVASGADDAPGGAAYVVNEWIDGETLAERLGRGPAARARGPHRRCAGWPRASPRRTASAWPSAG